MKQNFRENKVVTSKTLFFVTGSSCTPYFICLNVVLTLAILYGNAAFSILVLSTKKQYSSFSKKVSAVEFAHKNLPFS